MRKTMSKGIFFANNCPVCNGGGLVWLGPPGNKYSSKCYECGGDGKTEADRKREKREKKKRKKQ